MDRFYPEIIFPSSFCEFFKNSQNIIEKSLTPKIPTKPIEPARPQPFQLLVLISPLLFGGFIFAFTQSLFWAIITFLLILALIIFQFINEKREYPTKLLNFNNGLINYYDELEKREKQVLQIKSIFDNKVLLNKERLNYINNELLKDTRKAKYFFENPILGKNEEVLKIALKTYFGESVKTNRVIQIFRSIDKGYNDIDDNYFEYDNYRDAKIIERAFVPDFIFEHPEYNLCIDIEVDEPYTINNKPIHYCYDLNDEKRNSYFLNNGWIILRFSEEQVTIDPIGCCKELAILINELTGDDKYLFELSNHQRIYKHKKWQKSDIPKLISLNYRNEKGLRIETVI